MSKKKRLRSNKIEYDGPSWETVKKKLRPEFAKVGLLEVCELNYECCVGNALPMNFAHSKRRNKIATKEEMAEVIRSCTPCHASLDANQHEVTENIVKEIIANRIKPVANIYDTDKNKRGRKTTI